MHTFWDQIRVSINSLRNFRNHFNKIEFLSSPKIVSIWILVLSHFSWFNDYRYSAHLVKRGRKHIVFRFSCLTGGTVTPEWTQKYPRRKLFLPPDLGRWMQKTLNTKQIDLPTENLSRIIMHLNSGGFNIWTHENKCSDHYYISEVLN